MLAISDQRFANREAYLLRSPEDIITSAIGDVHGPGFLQPEDTRFREIKCRVVRGDNRIMRLASRIRGLQKEGAGYIPFPPNLEPVVVHGQESVSRSHSKGKHMTIAGQA